MINIDASFSLLFFSRFLGGKKFDLIFCPTRVGGVWWFLIDVASELNPQPERQSADSIFRKMYAIAASSVWQISRQYNAHSQFFGFEP